MIKTFAFLLLLSLATSSAALADTIYLTSRLGTIIGSEEFCGLNYNQKAIKAWIEKNIKDDDLNFVTNLDAMTDGAIFANKNKSKSEKTAHCIQISRTAKSMGFIK